MAALAKAERIDFSPEQVGLIKRMICVNSTDDELALFMNQCKRTGLDPFSKQIHAVKRWDGRQRREVMSIQVGIDGFRLIAERTGETDGQDGPQWCGADGVWKDVWVSDKPPAAARVIVYRKGCSRGYTGIATLAEYGQRNKEGELNAMWARMPATMLAKCSEGLAIRKAFPAELAGLYTTDEMQQASNEEPVIIETLREDNHKQLPAPSPSPSPHHQLLADLNECDTLDGLKCAWAETTIAYQSGRLTEAEYKQHFQLKETRKAELTPKPIAATPQPAEPEPIEPPAAPAKGNPARRAAIAMQFAQCNSHEEFLLVCDTIKFEIIGGTLSEVDRLELRKVAEATANRFTPSA